MKIILYHQSYEKFEKELKDYNFNYESDYEQLKNNIDKYDGLIAFGLDNSIDLSNLKWIQSLGAGVDWIINNNSLNDKTIITRVTEGLEVELFEYVLARILFYYQNIKSHYENQKNSSWVHLRSTGLRNKKVLIVGTGQIGSYIGKKLNSLNMEVYGINTSGYQIEGFEKCFTLNDIKEEMYFDIVVNVLPSTKDTIGVLNENFFNLVKQDVFINVGRANALKTEVLVNKLNSGKIKQAFLDVFDVEPLPSTSKLWKVDHLYISPHIAAITRLDQLVETIKSNYNLVSQNKEITSKVNIKKGY